jgi:hypothetical protein
MSLTELEAASAATMQQQFHLESILKFLMHNHLGAELLPG